MSKTQSSCKGYDIYYAVAHRSQAEIDSFKSRYEDFDETLIPEIFETALDLKVESFKKSDSWGSSHVIYFIKPIGKEELVLRANTGKNKDPEVVMLVEEQISRLVTDLGLKTNEVIYSDVSRKKYNFDFQIQKKLVGFDPEINYRGSKKDYDLLSYQLGEYVARYHSLEFKQFGRFDPEKIEQGTLVGTKNNFYDYLVTCLDFDLSKLVEFKVINASDVSKIKKFFETRKTLINDTKGVLNHHDLADHNLMYDNQGLVGVFDWEAAVIGDPVLDLASCPTWGTLYPRKKQLLAGYQSVRALPEDFDSREKVYRLRTMIWKVVYAIRMDILNKERMERIRKVFEDVGLKLKA